MLRAKSTFPTPWLPLPHARRLPGWAGTFNPRAADDVRAALWLHGPSQRGREVADRAVADGLVSATATEPGAIGAGGSATATSPVLAHAARGSKSTVRGWRHRPTALATDRQQEPAGPSSHRSVGPNDL